MKILIPSGSTKKITQPNQGEIFGQLWGSYNLDLISNRGMIRVAPQSIVKMANNSGFTGYDIDFGLGEAVVRTSADGTDRWWMIAGLYLFKRGFGWGGSDWAKDAISGTPTMTPGISDAVDFAGALVVTQDTGLQKLVAGTWSGFGTLTTGIRHPLRVGFDGNLAVGNDNIIQVYDTSYNVNSTRLTFPKQFRCLWIRSSANAYYFGCQNMKGGKGKVFVWYGKSAGYDGDYDTDGQIPLAGTIDILGVCHTITEKGLLLGFSGAGFKEVARLPIADNKVYQMTSANIHPNGMTLIDGQIHVLLSQMLNSNTDSPLENMMAGVWNFNKDNGLTHRYSITKALNSNIKDYGSPIVYQTGVLYEVETQYGKFIAGVELFTDNITTHVKLIVSLDTADTITKQGFLITSEIPGSEIEETWQKLYLMFSKLASSNHRIWLRYRLDKTAGLWEGFSSVSGTWASTTTFTSASNALAIGDEIMITSGEGSGMCALITGKTGPSGGLYTYTIDQTQTNASGAMSYRKTDWLKLGNPVSSQALRWQDFPLDDESSMIQLKVILLGAGSSPELEALGVKSKPNVQIDS